MKITWKKSLIFGAVGAGLLLVSYFLGLRGSWVSFAALAIAAVVTHLMYPDKQA